MKNILLLAVLGMALSGCNAIKETVDKDDQITQDWQLEKLYAKAYDELHSGNYTRAVKLYEILESRFPGSRHAQQAQLDTAYAHYKANEPEKALAAIGRFQLHYPQHSDMDYVLYLKGLVLLNENKSFFDRLVAQDWSDRDPKANREAYRVFEQLLERYPESKYSDDVKQRMLKLIDALGGNKIAIARYYMERGAYLAAANRAQKIIEHHQNTRFVEEALAIMEAAYRKIEQTQLADNARRVLAKNFPDSPYLQKPWHKNTATPWWRYY